MEGVENQVHYFAQSFLDTDSDKKKVNNPLLEQLFDGYDSLTGKYVLTKQLRKIYPKDWKWKYVVIKHKKLNINLFP